MAQTKGTLTDEQKKTILALAEKPQSEQQAGPAVAEEVVE